MAIIIETNDGALSLQLNLFVGRLGNYTVVLNITAAELTSIKVDATALAFLINMNLTMQAYAQNLTAYKKQLRKGGNQPLSALPALPVFSVAPPMPAADIEGRFRSLVQRIVNHPLYTQAMGEDMGIEGPVTVFNAAQGKPEFYIELSSGGHPNLRWTRYKFHGVEIWKDSGAGFVKLDRDMRPDYIDKSDLPAAGTSAVWKYKMIYLLNDEVTGTWSDEVTVTVFGEV